ncbi:vesicle transport protein SEC20-like isoform X2 [Oratosquilla oratoria]|uniref:vesicle transport protein SEC20-like isoform X2 n=1 Tax=Oratosquilla oratoria TaxID=337810 RepID=UPI003F757FBE
MPQDDQVYISVVKQDIVKYDVTLKSLVQEIRECKCNQAELDELVLQIRTRMNYLREQIAELKRLAQEQDSEEAKAGLNDEVSRCEKLLQDNHKSFRNATLAAQLAINQRTKDELLNEEDVDDNKLRNREKMSRDMMLKKSSQLTDDLLTVTRLIKENTDKSGKTVDQLGDGEDGLPIK